jgi:hypothetical protein
MTVMTADGLTLCGGICYSLAAFHQFQVSKVIGDKALENQLET